MEKYIGKIFGLLTVEKYLFKKLLSDKKHYAHYFLCKCVCGKTKICDISNLKNGHIQSCGCIKNKHKITHNKTNSRVYHIWANMKSRCLNPKNNAYFRYGGRGIFICNEWLNFEQFYAWATINGYQEDLTLDRIDNNGNYEPNNCRWVNATKQANNRRTNRIIEYNFKKYTVAEFSKFLNISYSCLRHRLDRKWSIERIVNTP